MGDTLEETPPTRRDKPQSLNINATESNTINTDTSSRYARNRSRMRGLEEREREREREREHSCDGVISGAVGSGTAVSRTDEFAGIDVPPRRESLNCEQTTSPSALSSSLNKALFGRNTRYPSSVVGAAAAPGTTTRKCVLTLDGYSYVIVASTPENLPGKRDEAQSNLGAASSSGSAGNNNSVGGATQGSSTGNAAGEQSPTSCELGSSTNATINGQVARHGSLTIVRRSNSRKNFTQIDAQQATVVATPSNTTSINFFQQLSEPAAERLCSTSRNTNGSSVNNTTEAQLSSSNKMLPSSPNKTNYVADRANSPSESNIDATRATVDQRRRNTSQHSTIKRRTEFQQPLPDTDTPSILSQETPWETENLPPVDTPDALNKAAIRLRELLRRMDHENVAYADLQRNLHYAARVLEAVFIDESRSPTTGKTKLGLNASSSLENEDEPDKQSAAKEQQSCNANCKNLNCSQHSHSTGEPSQAQDNNNSNSSCSLHNAAEAQMSDNQTSIESRTKGVSMAPQTHSGPTGPPEATESTAAVEEVTKTVPALDTVRESVLEEHSSLAAATKPEEAASPQPTTSATDVAGTDNTATAQSVSSSSSCSNKATVQRQRRLRTPVWARSMSTNKTYLKMVLHTKKFYVA